MNRENDSTKKNKSLSLKVKQGEKFEEDKDEMAYLTIRFQKSLRKHRGFKKKENPNRVATVNDLFNKCGKLRHYPILKMEYKDYERLEGTKISQGTKSLIGKLERLQ